MRHFPGRLPKVLKGWADGGLHVFCLAFFVYMLTVGPAVSLWDSGEFVCCAVGLDVGHPPGAPLYWLLLRLAVILAPAGSAAMACSVVSALCCAGAAAVLSLVAREVLLWWAEGGAAPSRASLLVAQTAAGLSWAFADSVWAAAVETEVYGAAALMSFSVLLLAMRWRRTGGGRLVALAWLLVGGSAGVHWLGWILLPVSFAVAGSRFSRRAVVIGFFAGLAAVALLVWLASGHFFDLAFLCDVAAVNVLGLPVGAGWGVGALIVPVALLLAAAAWRGRMAGRCAAGCLLVSLGFLSYAVPLLRSGVAEVSVGAPSDAQRLSDYMARSQYGERPLLRGPSYASRPDGFVYEARMDYSDSLGRYVPVARPADYSFPSSQMSFFPRMTSRADEALWAYNVWASPSGWPDSIPSFADNLRFFFSYQLNHMMLRYVMWNFCGRQNSLIGDGGYLSGNFICGIRPLDDARLHMVEYDSPADGMFALFGIPLVLALAGLVVAVRRARLRVSFVLLVWLLLAGPALVVFLNVPPFEPRERDYVFLPLFGVLCVFIAIALWRVYSSLRARVSSRGLSLAWASALAIAVPALMACQGFAPHDRSGDKLVDDLSVSVLNLCPPNSVIVVGGDNDTYPLWYAQQVLGCRRDVRVVNFGLLSSDWYVGRMMKPSRGADALVMTHGALALRRQLQPAWLLPGAVPDNLPLSSLRRAASTELGESFYLPTSNVSIRIAGQPVTLSVGKQSLEPAELLLLEILDENPSRPVCLMPDVIPAAELGLAPYVHDVGPLAYVEPDTAAISPLRRWQLLHGAVSLPDAQDYCPSPDEADQLSRLRLRSFCASVAEEAIARGDTDAALTALRSSLSWQPADCGAPDADALRVARLLYRAGDVYLSRKVLTTLASRLSLSLRRAQALSPHAPATAHALAAGLAPLALDLVDALRETGNADVAIALANIISSLPVAD